jgi:hypothetical protein
LTQTVAGTNGTDHSPIDGNEESCLTGLFQTGENRFDVFAQNDAIGCHQAAIPYQHFRVADGGRDTRTGMSEKVGRFHEWDRGRAGCVDAPINRRHQGLCQGMFA